MNLKILPQNSLYLTKLNCSPYSFFRFVQICRSHYIFRILWNIYNQIMLLVLLLVFLVTLVNTQNQLFSMNRCLGNCAFCSNNELSRCSGLELESCVKGYNGTNCLPRPIYAAQLILMQSQKSILPSSLWSSKNMSLCWYNNSKQQKIQVNTLGFYTKSQQNTIRVQILQNYQSFILSFNLIRGSWTPFSDSLRVTALDQRMNSITENFVQFQTRNEINPEVNVLRCKNNSARIIQKYQIQGTLNRGQTELLISFQGDMFSGADWALTNVKILFGCSRFLLFERGQCQKCEQGYYLIRQNGKINGCEPCPFNCTLCTSNQSCSSCLSGYTLQNGKCINNNSIIALPVPDRSIACQNGRIFTQSITGSVDEKLNISFSSLPDHSRIRLIFYVAFLPSSFTSRQNLSIKIDGKDVLQVSGQSLERLLNKSRETCKSFLGKGFYSLYKVITNYTDHKINTLNLIIGTTKNIKLGVSEIGFEFDPIPKNNSNTNNSNSNNSNSNNSNNSSSRNTTNGTINNNNTTNTTNNTINNNSAINNNTTNNNTINNKDSTNTSTNNSTNNSANNNNSSINNNSTNNNNNTITNNTNGSSNNRDNSTNNTSQNKANNTNNTNTANNTNSTTNGNSSTNSSNQSSGITPQNSSDNFYNRNQTNESQTNSNKSGDNQPGNSTNTIDEENIRVEQMIKSLKEMKGKIVLGVKRNKQLSITIQYPIHVVANIFLSIKFENQQFSIVPQLIKISNQYHQLKIPLSKSIQNQTLSIFIHNYDPIPVSGPHQTKTPTRNLFTVNKKKPIKQMIGQVLITRFDYLTQIQEQVYSNYSKFYLVLSWIVIIGTICFAALGQAALFKDFSILLQILFLHLYIYSEYLPINFQIILGGLQRMENLDYFLSSHSNEIQAWILGTEIQKSPPQFTMYNKDINFSRSMYPSVIISVAYLVIFITFSLCKKKMEGSLAIIDENEEYTCCQRLKLFLIRCCERVLNYWYQIWEYQYIVYIWSICMQLNNLNYSINSNRSEILNGIFCFFTLIAVVSLPVGIVIYLEKKYFKLDYFQYTYWYQNIFLFRLPQQSLPSNQHRIQLILNSFRYIILAICFSLLLNFPIAAISLILVTHLFHIVYLKVTHVQVRPTLELIQTLQYVLLIILSILMLVAYGTSFSISSNSYLILGNIMAGVCLLITLSGLAKFVFLLYLKIKEKLPQKQLSEFKPAIGTERIV